MSLSIEKDKDSVYDEANAAKYAKAQNWIFTATFINYAMAHWTRKSYTNIKSQMMAAGISPLTLTAMDSGFMMTYAAGSFITGQLGDHFSPVAVIGGGLLGSTICLFLIVYGTSLSVIQNAAFCGTWLLICQLLHGAFQATGGPVNTAIMGGWFPAKGRGLIFGLWTCHQYVGDIVAAIASAYIISIGWDYRLAMTIPAVVNGIWAFVNFYLVPNTPAEAGLITKADQMKAKSKSSSTSADQTSPIGFFQAFMLPNVINYATAFGFFKLVNYAMFFQLPTILASIHSSSNANVMSALYSLGMMPGGIVCGWVSDLYGGRRACVIATFMGVLCPLLWILAEYMPIMPTYILLTLLAFMGCLVGGPNNIITSAVAADLAEDPSIQGNNRALGTVTGIINGSGSITAAIGQLLIPIFFKWGTDNGVGYKYVWYFLILCTLIGTLLMSPKIIKELATLPTSQEVLPLITTRSSNQYQAVAI